MAGLLDTGDEPPELPTIVDEVFDLAKMRKPAVRDYDKGRQGTTGFDSNAPTATKRITRAELQGCGAGHIVVQMLIDVQVGDLHTSPPSLLPAFSPPSPAFSDLGHAHRRAGLLELG